MYDTQSKCETSKTRLIFINVFFFFLTQSDDKYEVYIFILSFIESRSVFIKPNFIATEIKKRANKSYLQFER